MQDLIRVKTNQINQLKQILCERKSQNVTNDAAKGTDAKNEQAMVTTKKEKVDSKQELFRGWSRDHVNALEVEKNVEKDFIDLYESTKDFDLEGFFSKTDATGQKKDQKKKSWVLIQMNQKMIKVKRIVHIRALG